MKHIIKVQNFENLPEALPIIAMDTNGNLKQYNGIGTKLDIVGWTNSTITINANGWASSSWPYTINNISYEKNDREDNRTLIIPYSGNADEIIQIIVKRNDGNIYSNYLYTIPHIYETSTVIENINKPSSIIVINNGTLTINNNVSVKEIYVNASAELAINDNAVLTVRKLVLRTTTQNTAILTNHGIINADNVFYTRIIFNLNWHMLGLPLTVQSTNNVFLSNHTKTTHGTSWWLKSYSEHNRAEYGISSENNWVALPNESPIYGPVGYEMFSNTPYYREYYFPVDLTELGNIVNVSYTENGAAGPSNAGWNIICSPLTCKYYQPINNPEDCITIQTVNDDGTWSEPYIPEIIYPGIVFTYQAPIGAKALEFTENKIVVKYIEN